MKIGGRRWAMGHRSSKVMAAARDLSEYKLRDRAYQQASSNVTFSIMAGVWWQLDDQISEIHETVKVNL